MLSLLVAGALAVGAVSVSANDPLSSKVQTIQEKTEAI